MTQQAQANGDLNLLQQKARAWALKVVELHNTPVPDELVPAKLTLINSAKKIKSVIEKITGPISALQPINELGVIPVVVGVVGVAAAAAAITKWTLDYNKFKTMITERNRLIESGLSPNQANALVTLPATGLTRTVQTFGKYALLGGGLFLAAKYFRLI